MTALTVASPAPAAIDVRGLERQFVMGDTTVQALRSVSFSIQPGEYSVMIGGAQPSDAAHVTGGFAVAGSLAMPE